MISPERTLIKSFITHSPDQVTGPEMGRFTLSRFKSKLEGQIFGMTQEAVRGLFQFLVKNKYIKKEGFKNPNNPKEGNYYSLTTPEYANSKFDRNALLAKLADLPLSKKQREQVIDRVEAFLFRAGQSSFTFAFSKKRFSRNHSKDRARENDSPAKISGCRSLYAV